MKITVKKINFDMDGTIANLYGRETWLEEIIARQSKPYRVARPLVDMRKLARELNRLQSLGYEINIISWLAKNSNEEYDKKVTKAKVDWLNRHLGSVHFDNIHIVAYGTPKQSLSNGILFDDEKPNRDNWNGIAFDVNNILEILRGLE